MHSLIDPQKEAEKLRRAYPEKGMKVFFGLAGGYQIRPFLSRSTILIVEPDPMVLRSLLTQMDFSDILSREKVYLTCRPERDTLSNLLKELYIPLLEGDFHVIPHRLYRGDSSLESYETIIRGILDDISADCSTQKRLGRQWQRNIIRSLEKAVRNPFDPACFSSHREAVLTAAGPGLEKELDSLSERKSDTLLLTVDTALPALLQKNIIPDAVVTIDPQAIGYLHFMEKLPPDCRIIADWGTPLPPSVDESRISWFCSPHPLCRYFMTRGNLSIRQIETGGNVTQAALALLNMAGLKKITLLGADFSYPEGKPYCRGSYFPTWYARMSLRLNSLENSLVQFVLERSSSVKTENDSVYSSPLLRRYEEDFLLFVESRGGTVARQGQGKWLITWEKADIGTAPCSGVTSLSAVLREYGSLLERFLESEDFSLSPLLATLIPLGYAFYSTNGEKALKKSAEYTLRLIKKENSLKKTYTSL